MQFTSPWIINQTKLVREELHIVAKKHDQLVPELIYNRLALKLGD